MRTGSRAIRERREKSGINLEVLADFVGVSKATMSRTETGQRIPPDDEIIAIAEALKLDAERLIERFDLQREAQFHVKTLLLSGGFFDLLQWMEEFIAAIEQMRIEGAPRYTIPHINQAIGRIRIYLEVVPAENKPPLYRLLAKALIIRASIFTMTLSDLQAPVPGSQQIGLEEIETYSHYLQRDDAHFLDMSLALPAMVHYLTGCYDLAAAWNRKQLPNIKKPYVRGLLLRDQIVISGRQNRLHDYKRSLRQAGRYVQRGLLDLGGYARILEGRVRAMVYLKEKGGGVILEEAEQVYAEAEQTERRQPFIASQIARTAVHHLTSLASIDEERVLYAAANSIRHFRAYGYQRHLLQVKQILRGTDLPQLVEFSHSIPG